MLNTNLMDECDQFFSEIKVNLEQACMIEENTSQNHSFSKGQDA